MTIAQLAQFVADGEQWWLGAWGITNPNAWRSGK
jgi:hypothetical protein